MIGNFRTSLWHVILISYLLAGIHCHGAGWMVGELGPVDHWRLGFLVCQRSFFGFCCSGSNLMCRILPDVYFLCCPSRLKFTSLFICLVADHCHCAFSEASNAKTDDVNSRWKESNMLLERIRSFWKLSPLSSNFAFIHQSWKLPLFAAWMFQFTALPRHPRQAFVTDACDACDACDTWQHTVAVCCQVK